MGPPLVPLEHPQRGRLVSQKRARESSISGRCSEGLLRQRKASSRPRAAQAQTEHSSENPREKRQSMERCHRTSETCIPKMPLDIRNAACPAGRRLPAPRRTAPPDTRLPRRPSACNLRAARRLRSTANLRTRILDVRGFDSNIILSIRGGIRMSIGEFPKILGQQILVGIILVGRWGVDRRLAPSRGPVCHETAS